MFLVPVTRRSNELARGFDRLFDDTFERFFTPVASDLQGPRSPALDLTETDRAYVVKLEMPGVAKEDVQISVEGRAVNVQAQTQRTEEKKDGERVLYRERSFASYARSFTLPAEIDPSDVTATLEHGVLNMTLPKRSAQTTAKITVR
jgi:HSP20 family protein